MEIGSEFWFSDQDFSKVNQTSKSSLKFNNISFTSSGRGAISLVLQQVQPIAYTVLLPNYICSSMILPFTENGYDCLFYDVDENLQPVLDDFTSENNIGVFLHLGYFGFETNRNLSDFLTQLHEADTIIIEDITHTLFSDFKRYSQNDYYVASIRKWFGVATGGFVASDKNYLSSAEDEHLEFLKLRSKALALKTTYLESKDETIKGKFLYGFKLAESLLDKQSSPYVMDEGSKLLYFNLDVDNLVKRRRENYQVLADGIRDISYVESVFGDLSGEECPFFYPIRIKRIRDEVRQVLIDEKIYCPVHWPISEILLETQLVKHENSIYNEILSIPCDQRYGKKEMNHIISVLKSISGRLP